MGLRIAAKKGVTIGISMYIGHLAEDTTKSEIEAFLLENGVESSQCWLLGSKVSNSVSARVRIPTQD